MTDFSPTAPASISGLVTSVLGGLVRHGLTYLAGLLAAGGALTGDQTVQFVSVGSSLALAAVSFVWSYLQKKHAAKALATAKAA